MFIMLGSHGYALERVGTGRFEVKRDGQSCGELLGRMGAWSAVTVDGQPVAGIYPQHKEAIEALHQHHVGAIFTHRHSASA